MTANGNDDSSGDDDGNNIHARCLVNTTRNDFVSDSERVFLAIHTQYVFMLTTFIALIHLTDYIPLSLIKTLIASISLSLTVCLSVSRSRPSL